MCAGFATAAARAAEGAELALAAGATRACSFRGQVLEQAGGLGTLVSLDNPSCSTGPLPSGTVVWDAERPPPSGADVSGWGWVRPLGDDEFAAARRAAGARAQLFPSEIEVRAPTGGWALVADVRSRFSAAATAGLEPREAALLLGLCIGDTSRFSARDIDAFRASGLAHLLAVSGSNVAIVLGAVALAARRLAYARRLALTLAAAVAFVAVVGPDGSVLRAAVMGSVALLAGGWIRPVDPVHSLPFALVVLLAARPTLVTSAGLHLSAAATLGIVLWSRPLAARLRWLPRPVAGSLAVTLAAQAGVAPLLVALFERLSLVAPVTNVLVAPAVAFATLAGMGASVVAPFAPTLASLMARSASPALRWILAVAEASTSGAWAEAAVPRSWGWTIAAAVLALVARSLWPGAPVVSER